MVISDEFDTPYMRPPLSKELWFAEKPPTNTNADAKSPNPSPNEAESLKFKQWNGIERSLYYEPIEFYTHPSKLLTEPNGGVSIVRGYTVKKIDVENRTAILTDATEIKYNKCLIATGSTPKNLPVFEKAAANVKERVSLFKTVDDYSSLKKHVDQSKSVAIIGGGFLGSELAFALIKYGKITFERIFFFSFLKNRKSHKKLNFLIHFFFCFLDQISSIGEFSGESKKLQVHQVFHEKGNMGKILPEFLCKWTTERVREAGVNVIPNTEVERADFVNNQIKLTLQNGQSIVCDHVVVAVGSEPNVSLGIESGLEIENVHGGYLVNAELAARNHLYVVSWIFRIYFWANFHFVKKKN